MLQPMYCTHRLPPSPLFSISFRAVRLFFNPPPAYAWPFYAGTLHYPAYRYAPIVHVRPGPASIPCPALPHPHPPSTICSAHSLTLSALPRPCMKKLRHRAASRRQGSTGGSRATVRNSAVRYRGLVCPCAQGMRLGACRMVIGAQTASMHSPRVGTHVLLQPASFVLTAANVSLHAPNRPGRWPTTAAAGLSRHHQHCSPPRPPPPPPPGAADHPPALATQPAANTPSACTNAAGSTAPAPPSLAGPGPDPPACRVQRS